MVIFLRLWHMYSKSHPFPESPNGTAVVAQVLQGGRPAMPEHVLRSLIVKCWAQSPDHRPAISEVFNELMQCLQFLRANNSEPLRSENRGNAQASPRSENKVQNPPSLRSEHKVQSPPSLRSENKVQNSTSLRPTQSRPSLPLENKVQSQAPKAEDKVQSEASPNFQEEMNGMSNLSRRMMKAFLESVSEISSNFLTIRVSH